MEVGYEREIVKFKTIHVPVNIRVFVDGVEAMNGTNKAQQLLRLKGIIKLIFQDSNVEYVVRLHGSPDSWHNLSNIFEAIQGDVGGLMVRQKWVCQTEIDTFTKTANSRQAIGDEARHGVQKWQPPKKPMTLQEAKDLIALITNQWLDYKVSQQT